MVGGGATAFDCSGDDKPDLLLAGGTSQASLWRNDSATGGALRFSKIQAGVELGGVTISLSGLAVGSLVGIVLNAILPGNDFEFDTTELEETAE